MSPITVFTVASCPYCKQVKSALEDCKLPYSEISLSTYPQKRKDLLRLTGDKVSVPQLFVHNEWIGGVDATLGFLRDISRSSWSESSNNSQESPMEKLERELGPRTTSNGSQNPRFMVPIMEEDWGADHTCCDENDDCEDVYVAAPLSEDRLALNPALPRSATDTVLIVCPDGTNLTVLQMTEKLKQILQYGKRRYHFTSYKNCCTAQEIVDALEEKYSVSRADAEEFGRILQKHNMMHHVCDAHMFQDTTAFFFRLQCFHTPDILNSYRIWPAAVQADAHDVMQRLTRLFQRIEDAVIGPDGNINYRIAFMCADFPAFEDAVCELQRVDLSALYGAEMVAFAVNVYNMMMKYSFMRLGIPVTESCRTALLNQVRFNVAGYVFSLQEWLDGILRGNRKSPLTKAHAFSKKDPRIGLASKVGEAYACDCRIHFAIHCWSRCRRSPPVKIFTGAALEEELVFVAQAFCEEDDNVAFSIQEKRMRLAPVFRRYKPDFLERGRTIPRVVLRFLHGPRRAKLHGFLSSRRTDRCLKMSSRAEDWTLGISDFVPFDASRLTPNVRRIGKCVRSTTCSSSYRPQSTRGSTLRGSQMSDGGSVSSMSVPSSVQSLGPARKHSGGRVKPNKTDSTPKPIMRRNLDCSERTFSLDEMDSNVSSASICSSERLHTLGDNLHSHAQYL